MDKNTFIEIISAQFPSEITLREDAHGLVNIQTDREHIIDVLGFIKNNESLQFIYLTDITAVHYPEEKREYAIVYHVHSLIHNLRTRITVYLEAQDLNIPSATVLWNGANWMERETYDFFGVNFEGHPDLRRILNMDDLGVFPMRKEYPLEDPNKVDKKDFYFGR